ncbi:MAG: hypothetical protein J6N70_09330 [Oribacterium sp.]|nr:hypothetical protein [Oribacterium sp.]
MYETIKAGDIDFDRLRDDLMDHYGTATGFFPMAFMDVSKVQDASAQELVDMAEDAGFDMRKYLRRW